MNTLPVPVFTTNGPAALARYCQAMVAQGTAYCSGQIPLDPATGTLLQGTIQDMTRRCMDNLNAVLQAAGTDLAHVVKVNVYLADMDDYAAMNEIYASYFTEHPAPARACVQVGRLPRDARIEIDCVAVLP